MASDPEELLRSIERTREELANTVDTIAGRLDPKRVAKRGVDAMRDGVTTVIDGARVKLHLGPEQGAAPPRRRSRLARIHRRTRSQTGRARHRRDSRR